MISSLRMWLQGAEMRCIRLITVAGDVQSFCEPFVSFVWDWASLETHSDSIGRSRSCVHPQSQAHGRLSLYTYTPLEAEITSSNHAKLTDFGGCRPVTEEVLLA